jgi:DNA-binding transcriptional ArsR family regulator
MRDVFVIEDLETLRAIAEPTRIAILELLAEPMSVSELAEALGVPRTRLYRHVELLHARGLIEPVEERRRRAQTERVYRLTASTIRPDPNLLRAGDAEERVDAISTLLFDATKSDLRRVLLSGEVRLDEEQGPRRLGVSRSIAFLTPEQADLFIGELEALHARFDQAHDPSTDGARPYAFTSALYPSARRIG